MVAARINLREPLASRDVALAVAVVPPRDDRSVCSEADAVSTARRNLREPLTSRGVALAGLVVAPRHTPVPLRWLEGEPLQFLFSERLLF